MILSGIQQVGIGVPNVHKAFKWYREKLGMDIRIFEEAGSAELMKNYTGGQAHSRHAILAMHMQGGGGFEIWQYTSRIPEPADFSIELGDYGIFAAKLKSKNIKQSLAELKGNGVDIVSEGTTPEGKASFYLKGPYGNVFQVVESETWFRNEKKNSGGVAGAIIGVSDIDAARKLYSDVLGYDTVVYDETDTFNDLANLPSGDSQFRRVLLRHSKPMAGGFSALFGASEIELVQRIGQPGRKIFNNRYWGDLGFIHLCFDVVGMDSLREKSAKQGFGFTVDSSNSFDMGEAAGHFAYVEDPDGTLIEFVETHKVPVVKKLGWYINMQKRNPQKKLPDWMVGTLRFNRVK